MEQNDGTMYYKFIPTSVVSFSNIKLEKELLRNDAYEKWAAITEVKGEYILCRDTNKLKKRSNYIVKESYKEYLEFMEKHDIEKDRWIYNILDGIAEQNNIIYRDDNHVIIPSYTWDSQNIEKLHILCMPMDKTLRTIRELSREHISLLKYMKFNTLQKIEEIYFIKEENLKIYFHYEPSTYHLHIHFINTGYTDANSSVEYSHSLDSVIFNLDLDSNYYRKIKLNRRI